jgi:fatty acid desaturase
MPPEDRDGVPEAPDPKDRYRRGLPDHHDPTAGLGGAAPAYSALTLRLWLAAFGLLLGAALAVWFALSGAPGFLIVLFGALAAIAVIDLAVVVRRKRRGEPG